MRPKYRRTRGGGERNKGGEAARTWVAVAEGEKGQKQGGRKRRGKARAGGEQRNPLAPIPNNQGKLSAGSNKKGGHQTGSKKPLTGEKKRRKKKRGSRLQTESSDWGTP